MDTNTTNNNNSAANDNAELFARAVEEARRARDARLDEKIDNLISGVARTCVAAEDAASWARAAAENTAPPVSSSSFVGRVLIGANSLADKVIFVMRPLATAAAVAGGLVLGGRAIKGALSKKGTAPTPVEG